MLLKVIHLVTLINRLLAAPVPLLPLAAPALLNTPCSCRILIVLPLHLTICPGLGLHDVDLDLLLNELLELVDNQLLLALLGYFGKILDVLLVQIVEHGLIEHVLGDEGEDLQELLVLVVGCLFE